MIKISHHAKMQMLERGTNEDEVRLAILKGEPEMARKGRICTRKIFNLMVFGEIKNIK